MIGWRRFVAVFSAALCLVGVSTAALSVANAQEWRPLGGGLRNVSGMALVENGAAGTTVLVVHDNKKETEPRAGLVVIPSDKDAPAVYTALPWPKDGASFPVDLEAVCAVPDAPGEYVALASGGTAYQVRLDTVAKTLTLVRSFDLPKGPEGSNYEGFTLCRMSGGLFAIWAHRGSTTSDAVISWAPLDLSAGKVDTPVKTVSLRTPWPVADSRPVSDLKVDAAGNVFVSSASDPGDDGPFTSALYLVGAFRSPSSGSSPLEFSLNPAPVRLYRSVHHKIEGFEIVPGPDGGIVVGTDDEGLGASVWRNWD